MNQLVICLNGIDKRVLKKNINGVLIAKTDQIEIEEKYTFLQAEFSSIDDLIKAKHINIVFTRNFSFSMSTINAKGSLKGNFG